MAPLADLNNFLTRVQALIAAGQALFLMRTKNKASLAKLEMSVNAALREVAGFSPHEYCKGPEDDRDRPGQICWIFGIEISGTVVYVKLTIQANDGQDRLVVLSFHEPEWPMRFPFN